MNKSFFRSKVGCFPLWLLVGVAAFLCSMVGLFSMAAAAAALPYIADTPSTPTTAPTIAPTSAPTHVPTIAPTRAIPTPKPTKAPTQASKPTPKPTAKPKPTQAAPPTLTLAFTCALAVDYSYGQVCVHTLAGAALTISVVYCTGYHAVSSSLQGTEYADSSGNYTWNWTLETKCRGSATAYVSTSWHGQSMSNSDDFTVQ